VSAMACVDAFVQLVEQGLADPHSDVLTDQELAQVMTAVVKLYAARCEARGSFPAPLIAGRLNATEVATAASEMVRAVDLNMFDLSMWHGRPRPQ
jgi:hypothetical protein